MNLRNRWYLLLPLLPLIPYWWIVCTYATSLPIWDDYDAVLRFLNRYVDSSFADRIKLILEQHNEHRIVPLRLSVVIQYALFGEIGLKGLVIISNLFLSLLYGAIWVSVKRLYGIGLEHSLLVTALGFILLQPQYGDGMIWTSTALSSFPVALFALISFLLLEKKTTISFAGSILFAALSAFTQGNGVLVAVVSCATLLLSKRLKEFAIYAASSAAILFCFFTGYEKSQHFGPLDGLRANGVLGVIDYFFTFIGAAWGWSLHYPSLIAGIIFFILGIVGFFRLGPLRGGPFGGLFAFAAGSAALSALIRSASGISFALSPGRYTIVSVLLSISALVLFFSSLRRKRSIAVYLFSIVALIFTYFSYTLYTVELVKLRDKLVLEVAEWSSGGRGLTYPSFEHADKVLRESIQKKLYDIPQLSYGTEVDYDFLSDAKEVKDLVVVGINRYREGERFLLVEGFAFLRKIPSAESEVFLAFENDSHSFAIKPRAMDRTADIGDRFHNNDRGKSGFLTLIPTASFKSGINYKIAVVIKHKDKMFRREVDRTYPLMRIAK